MVEYVFHNIQSQPILFLHDYYFYYSLEDMVSDRKGRKEEMMGLPKPHVVWCMLFPLGTDENDAVVCLKRKSTREFIHLKNVLTKHSTKWLYFTSWLCLSRISGPSSQLLSTNYKV